MILDNTSSLLPSRRFSIGMAKPRLKASAVPRYPGFRKSIMDQSSESRFSTGVPVSATRCLAESFLIARACLVAGFLTFCASSSATQSQFTCDNSFWQRCARPYVVMTRTPPVPAGRITEVGEQFLRRKPVLTVMNDYSE